MTTGTTDTGPAMWRDSGIATSWSPVARIGDRLRGIFDRLIAASSLVANDPVLDVRAFAWTGLLRDHWRDIRDETARQAPGGDPGRPSIRWDLGDPVVDRLACCPRTRGVIARIPGIVGVAVLALAPGAHVPSRRGATKGVVTCHLGLFVPRDGDVRMRVGDRVVRWAEGETLVFDDTCDHAVWNDARSRCVLLQVRFERPLRNPGRWIAGLFPRLVRPGS